VTVKRILKNELYIGNMVQARTSRINYKDKKKTELPPSGWIVVKDTHEPVIDKATFDLVQERITSRIRSTGKGTAHIFASKIKCLGCGSILNKVSQGKYSYLRCKLYCIDPKKELCTSHSINLEKLIAVVTEKVRIYINKYCDEDYLARELMQEQDTERKIITLERNLKSMEKRIKEIEITLTNAYRDKANESISEVEYRIISSNLTVEMENLSAKRKELADELQKVRNSINESDKWVEVVRNYKDFERLTAEMVTQLIKYIAVGEKDRGTKEQKIIIHWNF
jgi:chaperonin cofactor prefoldin